MYFTYLNAWGGGSNVLGVTAPVTQWLFAEGTTRGGFDEYLCIQNPDAGQALHLTAQYLLGEGQGGPMTVEYDIPPAQRATIYVNQEVGPEKDVSVRLTGSIPFVAERPMYFNYLGFINGGHDVMGTAAPNTSWGFAFGYTGTGFDQYLCIMNPGSADATVTATYYIQGDAVTTQTKQYTVKAGTRSTSKLDAELGENQSFFVKLVSDQPVVAEVPTYFKTGNLEDGFDVLGQTP
jgi:hypothetical protein